MVLNMISTGVMTGLGHVYGNLMVNVQPKNQKLATGRCAFCRTRPVFRPGPAADFARGSRKCYKAAIAHGKTGNLARGSGPPSSYAPGNDIKILGWYRIEGGVCSSRVKRSTSARSSNFGATRSGGEPADLGKGHSPAHSRGSRYSTMESSSEHDGRHACATIRGALRSRGRDSRAPKRRTNW